MNDGGSQKQYSLPGDTSNDTEWASAPVADTFRSKHTTSKLHSLDMVRFVAASMVVLHHTRGIVEHYFPVTRLEAIFLTSYRGVDLFFVLSGFIIGHVHRMDIGRPERLSNYAFNRITRIYPAVWIMSAFAALLYLRGFGGADKAGKLTGWGIAASALLLPQSGDALVNVTWTLKYEMFFYLLFAMLILSKRNGLVLMAMWQGLALILSVWMPNSLHGVSGFYLRSICLEFGIGLLCALVINSPSIVTCLKGIASQWLLTATGVVCFVAGMGPGQPPRLAGILCGVGAGAIIVGLILLERSGRLRIPHFLTKLGDASYSIYLVHWSVIRLLIILLVRAKINPSFTPAFFGVAAFGIFAGVLFDGLVDQPLQRLLRQKLKPLLVRGPRRLGSLAPGDSSSTDTSAELNRLVFPFVAEWSATHAPTPADGLAVPK